MSNKYEKYNQEHAGMNVNRKNNLGMLVMLLCMMYGSVYGMNVLRPYQILLRPPYDPGSKVQAYVIGQFGYGSRSFTAHKESTNPLQIYQDQQSGLAMLNGFPECSQIGQKRIRIDADPDEVRGTFCPSGTFELHTALRFGLRFFFPHHLSLAVYQPYYDMQLSDVCWQDLTRDVSVQDDRTRAYLTNDICGQACQLGGLDLGGWHRKGAGDTTVSLEWFKNFAQQKDLLKNVAINGRLGVTLPTGLKADEDKLLAFAYGNDDAVGIVFGIGLDFDIGSCVTCGLDVQLMHLFGNSRCRRIKTSADQTDLLLLAKTDAFKDYGLTQQFSLYWQVHDLLYGAGLKVAYQFYKRGRDELSLTSNEFSTRIANSAVHLQGFTTHDIFAILSYDFAQHCPDESWCTPYIAAFAQVPFNGKRSITAKTAGFVLGVNF